MLIALTRRSAHSGARTRRLDMTDLPLTILHETPADAVPIERLHERTFGPGRFARTAFRIREKVGHRNLSRGPTRPPSSFCTTAPITG